MRAKIPRGPENESVEPGKRIFQVRRHCPAHLLHAERERGIGWSARHRVVPALAVGKNADMLARGEHESRRALDFDLEDGFGKTGAAEKPRQVAFLVPRSQAFHSVSEMPAWLLQQRARA